MAQAQRRGPSDFANGAMRRGNMRGGLIAAFSGTGVWLLPVWGCPVCLAAFAGTLSAAGLGVLATKTILTPLTAVFLAVTIGVFGFTARRRRRYGPLVLGLLGAALLLASKLRPELATPGYIGLASVLVASIWNIRVAAPEPACVEAPEVPAASADEMTRG